MGLQILIDASNGASDYGNKFGEPLIAGYTRTFGLRMPSGERREWIKPIMFRHAPAHAASSSCEWLWPAWFHVTAREETPRSAPAI